MTDGENIGTQVLTLDVGNPAVETAKQFAMKAKSTSIAATIKQLVAEETGITVKEMMSRCREARVARPRQLAMYLTRMYSRYSTPQIGRFFGGLDHTTVLWAMARVRERLAHDAKLVETADRLHAKIEEATGLTPEIVQVTDSLAKKIATLRLKVYCDPPSISGITN